VEGVLAEARSRGLLLYSATGNADGANGDLIVLGPPFVITDDEIVQVVARLGDALEAALRLHG
jgi:hypothetical protein